MEDEGGLELLDQQGLSLLGEAVSASVVTINNVRWLAPVRMAPRRAVVPKLRGQLVPAPIRLRDLDDLD